MNRLRRAMDGEPVPRDLETRVRGRLARPGSASRGPSSSGRLISSLALLAVVLAGTQYYAVAKTRRLFQTGVDDHIRCAIAGAYPRQNSREEMIGALGPWAPILQPVVDQAPGNSLVSAHRCTVNGRNYVHIILRRNQTLISLIMTRRAEGETFPRSLTARVVNVSGISLHEGALEGYSVSGFVSGAWLGYVISGLPGGNNEELARRVAPVIARYTGI